MVLQLRLTKTSLKIQSLSHLGPLSQQELNMLLLRQRVSFINSYLKYPTLHSSVTIARPLASKGSPVSDPDGSLRHLASQEPHCFRRNTNTVRLRRTSLETRVMTGILTYVSTCVLTQVLNLTELGTLNQNIPDTCLNCRNTKTK